LSVLFESVSIVGYLDSSNGVENVILLFNSYLLLCSFHELYSMVGYKALTLSSLAANLEPATSRHSWQVTASVSD